MRKISEYKNNKSKDEKKIVKHIVDPFTGEITGEIYEGDRIVPSDQSDYTDSHILKFKKGEIFIKAYVNPITILWQKLNTTEFAVTMALMPYISYQDCILRYKNNPMKLADMATVLDINYDTFRKTILQLVGKGVLAQTKTGSIKKPNTFINCYVMNPYIIFKGTDLCKEIAGLFVGSGWEDL
jgi:hypothetical protein